MAEYEIEISRSAERVLRRLTRRDQIRIAAAIQHLATDPRPRGTRKLSGYEDVYRIRVGAFRVLYSVQDRRLIVVVLKLGHRREIFR